MEIRVLDEVDSTNTYVKNHFGELADGDFVRARHQTAGRGRRGRAWTTPPDAAITGTFALKSLRSPFHGGCLAGLAGLELVRKYAPDAVSFLKWPNDIYIEHRKIAGILCEGVLASGTLLGVASGIGLKVNQSSAAMNRIDQPAASLSAIAGREFCVEKLAEELAKNLNRYYIIYRTYPEEVLRLWRKENLLIGESLELLAPDGSRRRGVFTAIDADGAMLMTSEAGEMWCFHCGDVKIDAAMIDFRNLKTKLTSGMKP